MRTLTSRVSLRLRPQIVHIALSFTLLVILPGCAALRGAGATAVPSAIPSPAATPVATPAATGTPTPTSEPTQSAAIEHPTGATDVVLRVEWGGGFVPVNTIVTDAPQFTLYGDGTAVFQSLPGASGVDFDQPRPPFLMGHMSEAQMQELLRFALTDGDLAQAKTNYDFPGVADAGSTIFTISAGGVEKTVSVYALVEGSDGPDQADRDKLMALQQRLTNFETEARNGAVDVVSEYDPTAYKVVLFDDHGGGPAQGTDAIDWPWTDVQPRDFVKADESAWATLSMSRAQVAKLTTVPNGGQLSIWVKAPDGSLLDFAVRPWLPEELAAQLQS